MQKPTDAEIHKMCEEWKQMTPEERLANFKKINRRIFSAFRKTLVKQSDQPTPAP